MSTLAEIYLKLTKDKSSKKKAYKRLIKLKNKKEKPYFIPKNIRFKVSVFRSIFENTPIYTLNNGDKDKVILYFHGGGYQRQPLYFHWRFLNKLAQNTNAKIIVPIYPKTPKYDYTHSHKILTNLYKSILSEGKKVILAGDSSGGGLCLALCQSFEKSGILQPEKVITLAPWVDVTMSNPEITKIERVDPKLNSNVARVLGEFWANGQDLKDYKISPLYGDFKGLNNVYIFIGTRDILYPDNLLLYNKLQKEGVNAYLTVGTNLNHVYPVYPTVEGKKAIEQISKIISS